MIFRRTIISALFVGSLAGFILSIAQTFLVNPIIFQAETFEVQQSEDHDHKSHDHGEDAWAPEDGAERAGFTLLSNFSIGIGFAAVLLSTMSQLQLMGVAKTNYLKGALWGGAGFLTFFVAPAIGLPPEIPGVEAAPVEHRQVWWLFAVSCAALGLMIMSFAPLKWKAVGVVLLALPYLVNVPHVPGPMFAHPDAETVARLSALHQQFIVTSSISNLLFWLVLGIAAAWVLNTWILKGISESGNENESASV